MNYCHDGTEGWIENKRCEASACEVQPSQVGWIERRIRNGGRVFIAVRRLAKAGKRREARDDLILLRGAAIRDLATSGLVGVPKRFWIFENSGGPAQWDWDQVYHDLIYAKSM